MSASSGPSRPGSQIPKRPLRFSKRRSARRRGFAAFLGVLVVVIAALAWGSTRGGGGTSASGPGGNTAATGPNGGTGTGGGSTGGPGTIVPGETPIKHVVFIIKENRTFNNY